MSDVTKVKVVDGYAVFVDGEQRSGGEVVEVPADVAEKWVRAGFAEPVKAPPAKATARRRKPQS